ncbi:MAG: HNH endonuclease signature motif containing protein [Nocardioides sp.]
MDLALADTAVTPTALLARVKATHRAAVAAEAELLVLSAAWADAHPDLGDEPYPARGGRSHLSESWLEDDLDEVDERRDVPGWSWSCAAPFGSAIGRTTAGGDALIRDSLVLRHRLPRVWARVVAGTVEAWRARRIAQAVLGAPDDVCATLDETLADIADRVGPVTLDRLIDEAMLRLHAEERELAQLAALDARYVKLEEASIGETGVATMTARADWKDLADFDALLSRLAAALGAADTADDPDGSPDSFDVRRARALGVLADPAAALALLDHTQAPRSSKHLYLFVHLSELAVLGLEPVGRNESAGRAVLEQQVRSWCGRTDTQIHVTGIIDLADHTATEAYEVRGRLRTRTDLIAGHCVFPWCARPARRCDHDHGVAHEAGGPTCECNIAPLCRRHHRLKTHAGWRYTVIDSGVWLWSDPHGQQFLCDASGTRDVTPPDRPVNAWPVTAQPRPACRSGPPG